MKKIEFSSLIMAIAIAALPSAAHAAQLLTYYDFNDSSDPTLVTDVINCSPDAKFSGGAAYTADAGGFSSAAGDMGLDFGAANNGAEAVTSVGGHLFLANAANAIAVSWWQNNTGNGAGGFDQSSSFWLTAPDSTDGQRGLQTHAPWSNGVVFMDQSGCCAVPAQRLTTAAGAAIAGDWQHFVLQRDAAGVMEIWIDGTMQATSTGAEDLDLFSGEITIGARQGGLNSFTGVIDEFSIFAGTLSADEIADLAGGITSPDIISAPLPDADADGLADVWEAFHGLSITDDGTTDVANGPLGDQDEDGLNNLGEFKAGLSPLNEDFDNDTLLDGVETNTGTWLNVANTGTNPFINDTDGDGLLDNVENPDLPFVDASQPGSDPNIVDTDGDGIDDAVEVAINYNPNNQDTDTNGTLDGAEDPDGDTLMNSEEVALGTNLGLMDTDDDGFDDNVESNTGTWVSVGDTGTDPLNPDTDGDTILDGIENHDLTYDSANASGQPGTDPNLVDTDGDIAPDALELAEGTDPTDPDDTPAITIVTVIPALLGGDLTDPENDGVIGANVAGPPQTAGTNFNWLSIGASNEANFGGFGGGDAQGAFDVFDNLQGAADKWCCAGPPLDLTVEFEEPVSLTHFTVTSSRDVPDRDPRDWQIQGSNDGTTFTPIFDQSGDPQLWTARNQTLRFDLGSASDSYKFIRYAVARTNNTNHQITEIEYFGTAAPVEKIRITAISYDEDNDEITLTWTSDPGREYTIFYSTDLQTIIGDVGDGFLASAGETTTESVPNPLPGSPRVYFMVSENPE